MKYYQIDNKTTLSDLIHQVGSRNLDSILHINGLERTPDIGKQFTTKCGEALVNNPQEVAWQRKYTILNKFAGDSDLFEKAATSGSSDWKLLSLKDTFVNLLKVPDSVELPDTNQSWGNGEGVPSYIYSEAMSQLKAESTDHAISSSVFNRYSTIKPAQIDNTNIPGGAENVFRWFRIPWGDVTLYSSIGGESVDFPVYPEEMQDATRANYTTMPDIIYQYEPWQIYTSSGPRQNTYVFDFHRDMWTGDHRDGLANRLIRFCQACCYAKYTGSAVNTPIVTLYLKGSDLITGIVTEVATEWDGPIGLDGFYLHVKLSITIVEVSKEALNYDVVKQKPLIG